MAVLIVAFLLEHQNNPFLPCVSCYYHLVDFVSQAGSVCKHVMEQNIWCEMMSVLVRDQSVVTPRADQELSRLRWIKRDVVG